MPEPTFTSKFYLTINPGLEDLALAELKSAIPEIKTAKKNLGGIEFECDLYEGLELNAKLKIPSRILLRLEEFAASDFPKLFKKLQRISWEGLLSPDTPLRFEVSSETSRLAIKKRIESTAEDAIKKYFKNLKIEKLVSKVKPEEQRIFLRLIDDICTLSIDTSGEHLHKRGYRKLIGEAPLRENLASALLNALFNQGETFNPIELIDPMMGSGTFLLEAYHYFSKSHLRGYAFEKWPFVVKEAEVQKFSAPSPPKGIMNIKWLAGFDQDEEAIRITKENLLSLKTGSSKEILDYPKFDIVQKNLFEGESMAAPAGASRFMICNPPYGKRLKVQGKITDFYSGLFEQCEQKLKPSVAGFLISDEIPENQIRFPKNWMLAEQIKFRNGGIKVRFLIFKAHG